MRQHATFHGGSLIGDKLDLVIASEVVGLVRLMLRTHDEEWRHAVNQGLNEALCSPVSRVGSFSIVGRVVCAHTRNAN